MIGWGVAATASFVFGIWALGRWLDPTVRHPIDALDAIIEHLLRD